MLFPSGVFLLALTTLFSVTVIGLGLKCLRCDDVLEPRFCERIEYCSTGDVCSVQRYRKENGDISFWLGCLSTISCAKTPNKTVLHPNKRTIHGSVLCNDCCYGDLCNIDGCGSPAFSTSRGPICFNCAHSIHPTDCHHVTLCGNNEACDNHISAPIIVGKKRSEIQQRSYTPCSGCCSGDLCNSNCSAIFTSGTVINSGTTKKPGASEIPGNYAFYAQLTYTVTNEHAIFKNVTINEGSSYSSSTGIFTCKYSGAYVFSWTIATHGSNKAFADLYVNGNIVGTIISDSSEHSVNADSATGFVVTNLQVGDEVRIRILQGSIDGEFSTFSGWRLNHNVSFYAKADKPLTKPSSTRNGFIFKNVITNNGLPYVAGNGTFVCPESGLYALAFNVEALHKDYMVYFYKDTSKLNTLGVWPDSSSGSYRDSSTTLQLFQLHAGDAVHLFSGDSNAMLESPRSSYLGWLIQPGSSLNTPAFMEQLTSTSPSSYSAVLFSRELLDTTGSFYRTTGYTAPKDGVYVIFWNMEAYENYLKSTLVVNGLAYGYTVSDGRSSDYDSGSNVAVLRLRARDVVKVMQSTSADGDQTMISGFMLY